MRKTKLTPELRHSAYLAFQNIRQRCTNRNNKDFAEYGGRGIECALSQDEFADVFYRTECCELCGTLLNDENRKKADGRPIAAIAWSSAPRHLGPRDRFIGWSKEARRRNIRFLAYNTRFLILPWVEVAHLASHILGQLARRISGDWERLYSHPLYYLETFVDPARFRGTCYRASNWIRLGLTTGRGKDAPTRKATRPVKEVLGYPLSKRFRDLLSGAR